ncbi:MAG: hypothetical protein ABII09_04650 [Planctomycetota bacterium]
MGICLVLAAGAAAEHYFVTVEGELKEKVGFFQPAFSGVSAEGDCYLAVTDTRTGRTEIFGITKDTQKKLSDSPFQATQQGSAIVELKLQPN